ncbi:MoxR family ATPase [Catenulispora subtropica]|uniref:MoxR family ATPase n=1 Tax=Catenulispora subtropica TaxID=450798 RepID=A0ABP5ERC6_9ACTN
MTWARPYTGDGTPRDVELPPAPPWRRFPLPQIGDVYQPAPGLVDAVNAALCLRRPLLLTGLSGSGKSTAIESVAAELKLGKVLRWHITSRSTLQDALYEYDVLGRIHAQQLDPARKADDIAAFLRLGPLGTALLPRDTPRALLIDEIDKSDLDLPSDLLEVLERGYFEIRELIRHEQPEHTVADWDGEGRHVIRNGRVQCREFPFVIMTSNGERDFPAPFLRRCIRFDMPPLDAAALAAIIEAHLEGAADRPGDTVLTPIIERFVSRIARGETLAVDQLLNAAHLLAERGLTREERTGLEALLLRGLSSA